jgi:hypothetical protein
LVGAQEHAAALVDAAFNLGFKMRRLVKVGWDKEPDAVRRALAQVVGPYDPKDANQRLRRHPALDAIAWRAAFAVTLPAKPSLA